MADIEQALGGKLQGQDGKPFKVLHEDKTVPGSKNRPTPCSLSESYQFTPAGKPAVIVVLVQRFSQVLRGAIAASCRDRPRRADR